MESVFTPTPSRLTTSITKRKFFLLRWWEEENLSFLANWVVSKKKKEVGKRLTTPLFFASEVNSSPFFFASPFSRSLYGTKEQSEANSQMTTKGGAQEKKNNNKKGKGVRRAKFVRELLAGRIAPDAIAYVHPIPRAETV